MKKQKISIVVIALNAEKILSRCLNSIKNLADEIVLVVDDRTIDETVKIAKKYKARVYVEKFINFAQFKNFALSKAKGNWVLSLDTDEVITPELVVEIKTAIQNKKISGYLIPRKNIIFGAEIKHTRWSPDKHIWLWRKGRGKWAGEVHEEVNIDGRVGELKNPKIHYQHQTVGDFLDMINRYTNHEAKQKVDQGEKFSFAKFLWTPARSFLGRFVYKKGFLDGSRGFILSYLMAIYRLTTWIKVWEREKKS